MILSAVGVVFNQNVVGVVCYCRLLLCLLCRSVWFRICPQTCLGRIAGSIGETIREKRRFDFEVAFSWTECDRSHESCGQRGQSPLVRIQKPIKRRALKVRMAWRPHGGLRWEDDFENARKFVIRFLTTFQR